MGLFRGTISSEHCKNLGKKDKSSWMIGDNYEDTIDVSLLFGDKRNLTVQLLNSSRSVLIFWGTGKF